jgi:hypothetical protein
MATDIMVAAAQWRAGLALDNVAVLMWQGRHPHAGVQVGVVLAGLLVLHIKQRMRTSCLMPLRFCGY